MAQQDPNRTRWRQQRLLLPLAAIALVVALISSAAAASADPQQVSLANAGFESGDTSGWQVHVDCDDQDCGDGEVDVVQSFDANGVHYTAPGGSWFAVLTNACPDTTLSQSFSAQAGQVLSGTAFFATDEDTDQDQYIDTGTVEVLDSSDNVVATLYSRDVNDTAPTGSLPWTPFSYTIPADGTYTVVATSSNVADCGVDSWVGVDFGSAVNGTVAPARQLFGQSVTLSSPSGGLTGTTSVLMNGQPTNFVVLNDNTLSVRVTEAAGVGAVTLTIITPSGTAVLPEAFTAVAPVIVQLPTATTTPSPTSTSTPSPTATPTPSPTGTPTPADDCPSPAIQLDGAATLTTWPGPDGATIADVLANCQDGAFSGVSAIWTFDASTQAWLGWFANSGVEGANDITTFTTGTAYFILQAPAS